MFFISQFYVYARLLDCSLNFLSLWKTSTKAYKKYKRCHNLFRLCNGDVHLKHTRVLSSWNHILIAWYCVMASSNLIYHTATRCCDINKTLAQYVENQKPAQLCLTWSLTRDIATCVFYWPSEYYIFWELYYFVHLKKNCPEELVNAFLNVV